MRRKRLQAWLFPVITVLMVLGLAEVLLHVVAAVVPSFAYQLQPPWLRGSR